MNFDEDTIALFLIGFLTVVFIGAAWQQGEVLTLASGVMEFGLGAIAGYMSRKPAMTPAGQDKIRQIIAENRQLKQQLESRQQRRSPHSPEDETL
jgi:hypothetical protein